MKTIKDKESLTEVLNSVPGMSSRLLLHFILTQKHGVPFQYTLYQMSHEGGVKNPQRAIADLLEKAYLTRRLIEINTYEYVLHLDLIEHSK